MTGRTARGARRPVSPASCSREGRRAPYKSGLCRGGLRPSLRGGRRGRGARPNRDLTVKPGPRRHRPRGMRTKRAVSARSPRSSSRTRPARLSRRHLLAAAVVPSVILVAAVAGCSGASSSSGAASGGVDTAPSAAASGGAAPAAAGSAAAGSAAKTGLASSGAAPSATKYVPASQRLVYTAQLTVRAASVTAAASQATSIVLAEGGYVSSENASSGEGQPSKATATVTFKVPVAAYAATIAQLSGGGVGTQLSLTQQAQDVTQQVADVSSRVASDNAAIAQLRALLGHAGDVSSLLS